MIQKVNRKYKDVFNSKSRYVILMGGRGAGRSFVASQLAVAKLIESKFLRCATMRFILTDIRKSIYQEIYDRLEENDLIERVGINESRLEFNFGGNKIHGIGFRKSSSDQKSKLKSLANYNLIIIEEADEIDEASFIQLDDSLRTLNGDIKIVLLLNPPDKNHWIIKRWFNLLPTDVSDFYKLELKESEKKNTTFIHTTFLDNKHNLNQSTLENFYRYEETNPSHFHNMIMGLVPAGKRGLIYKDWKPMSVKDFEELDYPVYYGLDFGFSNDQCALVEVKSHNEKIYMRELVYELGLLNKGLSDRMTQLGLDKRTATIYADSAEPKSIAELRGLGWNVIATEKGAGSRKSGVGFLLEKEIYYTEDSVNLIREKNEYCWALDKNKEPTNEPSDGNDNLLDAGRYAVISHANRRIITII